MTSKRKKLHEDTSFRVLRLLQENPEAPQRKLAEAVGISVGSIHHLLKVFIEKGLVKLGDLTAAEDKRRYAYVLTPKGLARKATLTRAFLMRKVEELEALREEIDALSTELGNDCKSPVDDTTTRMFNFNDSSVKTSCSRLLRGLH
jgi:EPS-associated MarR family transcriptional regulator